jgi:hypothetical protein
MKGRDNNWGRGETRQRDVEEKEVNEPRPRPTKVGGQVRQKTKVKTERKNSASEKLTKL